MSDVIELIIIKNEKKKHQMQKMFGDRDIFSGT